MATAIEIKGRKGGKSKSRTPTEQPDDLQSVAKAKILLALGEGEFAGGLTAKDIYLDGTPLENADGSQNFSGVAWEFRSGTQAQTYIQGIPGSENEISLGTEIKSTTAWTHTFTNSQLSAIRLRLKWGALFTQEDNGDLVGNTVKYAIDLQTDGGTWQTVIDTAVTGKTTSGYERSHRIDLPQAGSTWTVRLRKITADANSAKVGDKMSLQSYTEVIDAKLRYPNTALLYIEFDSSQFNGSIPQIICEPRGRVIRVPDTYDPESRTYSGIWSGAFKWAWTDNPAWIFYDLVVSDRFGLGNRLTAQNISKWTLYEVAQYCDQLVPDGKGGDGQEPRYICNVYVQDRNDAYTVLRDFAAIFRGMVYWGGDQIVALADMPRDVDYTYTRANVIDGKFTYSSSSAKNRYTTALVSWSDPANAYADAMEPVFEQPLVARYGFNQLEMTAIGCTRQSEANRKGRWGILTNNKDRAVTFGVGLDGNIPQPGYIIAVADEMLAGRSNGGRISAVSGRVITFDRNVNTPAGARLQVNLPSGISQSRTIQSVNGARQVTVTTPFSETPQAESVWAIEWDDLYLQQYRVVSVGDNNDGTYTVTGAAHDPNKFARIDTGVIIDAPPVSIVPPGHQLSPARVDITSYSIINQGISIATMRATWPEVKNAIAYEAQWRRNDGNWINIPRSSTTSFDVSGIYAGRYMVRVRAINAAEISSGWTSSKEVVLTGKVGEPLAPVNLRTVSLVAGVEIAWDFPANSGDSQRTEIQYSNDQSGSNPLPLTDMAYPGNKYQQMGLQFAQQFWYRARLVDRLGNKSPWTGWVYGMASDNMDDYFRNLDDAIRDTDTWDELNKGIQDSSDAAQHANDVADAAQRSVDAMANDVAKNASDIIQSAQQGKANADNLAKEVRDRAAGDLANAKKAADDVAAAIKKAETDDAAVAKEAADNLLSAKNEVESQISSTNTTMQDGFDSLAQQIASVSAGTGEQFDSLKIWYFDNKTTEGWTGNNGIVLTDGWIRGAKGYDSYLRSPVDLRVSSDSYRYLKMRIRKVGTPAWEGTVRWVSKSGEAFNNTNAFSFSEPEYLNGIAVLSVQDIPWADAGSIYQIRLDMTTSTDDANYVEIDWVAIGRPTPGASQAQIQDLRSAMTSADAAEAAARNTLAVQLRGNETGTDPNKLVSGLLYNERKTRVTAEQAIASDVNTLRTDYNANKASVTQRLDTLTSENKAQANSLTQLDSGLKDANSKIGANSSAIQSLKTSVTSLDGRVSANNQAITALNNSITAGENLVPNAGMLNDGQGWLKQGSISTIDGYPALNSTTGWKPSSGKLQVTPGDILDLAVSIRVSAAASLSVGLRFDGPGVSNIITYTEEHAFSAGEKFRFEKAGIVVPAGCTTAILQTGGHTAVTVSLYNPVVTRRTAGTTANSTAINGLTTRVDVAEGRIETASQAITQLRGDVSSVQGDLAKKADASALQQLQTTVTQQGKTLSTQGSAITELQNSATNGKKNSWVQQLFYIRAPSSTYIPSLSDLAGVQPASISEVVDAASLDFTSAGSNVYAYFRALVYVSADKEVVCKPGSRVMDDTGQIYINSLSVAKLSSTQDTVTLSFKKGWNTIEVVTQQWSGNAYFRLGLKLSDNVDQMFSGAGQLAAASASQVLNSRVEAAEGSITSQGQSITQLNNSLGDVNKTLGNKADASALSSLATRVSNAEGKLSSQGESITALSNSITAGENLVPNPNMLNDGQGWLKQGAASTIDGYPALNSTAGWQPSSGKFQVTPGDVLDLAVSIQVSAAASLSVGLRFDGPGVSNVTVYTGDHAFTAGEKYRFEKTGIVVPAGCTTAILQTGGHTAVTVSLYNPIITRRTAAVTANAAAINSLTSRVTSTEGKITSQGQSLTSLQNTLSGLSGKVDGKADAGAVNSLTNRVTAAEGKLSAQGQSLTSLSNSLNTVNQANGNLWVDGSFESYAEGTTFSGATAMVTRAYNYSGSQCLRVRRDGGDKGNSDKTIGTRTTVRDQGVFRIEFYAMMPASESPPSGWNVPVGIHVQDAESANQWIEATRVTEAALGGRDRWVKFSGTAALPGGKTRGVLWISTRGTSGGVGYNLFIDDLVITDVTDAAGAQKTADAASTALTSLTTRVSSIDGQVTANSTALTKLTSRVNDAESSITGLNETVAQNGLAMANGFNQMRSMIGDNSASITQTNKTVTDLEKSTAEQVNTLNSKYGDMSATVQQTASTVADINGKLGAQWGVKVATGNGGTPVVAGIQLGINGSGQSQFLVSADMFGVYTPGAGGNAVMAFAVEGANAYLRSAMIKDASIDFAKISDSIQSTNYISGQQGWRINKGGWSEFSGGVYRGTVYANDGVFNGTINARDGKFSGTVEARNFIGDISNSGRFPDFTFDNRDNGVSRIVHHDSGDSSQGKTYTVNGLLFRWNGGGTVEIGIWINNIEVSHMTVRIETNVLNSSSRYIPIQATLSGVYERDVPCEIRVDERCQIISASATMTRGSGGWSS